MSKWMLLPLCVFSLVAINCGGGTTPEDRATTISKLTGDNAAGKTLWATNCTVCHGDDGKGKPGLGEDLTTADAKGDSDVKIIGTILNGVKTMTAFKDKLQDQEVANIVAHLRKDLQK